MARLSLRTVFPAVFPAFLLHFPDLLTFLMRFPPFWLGPTVGAVFAPLLLVFPPLQVLPRGHVQGRGLKTNA